MAEPVSSFFTKKFHEPHTIGTNTMKRRKLCDLFKRPFNELFPPHQRSQFVERGQRAQSTEQLSRSKNELKRLRIEHHISQEEMAVEIGVSRLSVIRWEKGEVTPSPQLLELLCQYFQKTPADLFPGQYAPLVEESEEDCGNETSSHQFLSVVDERGEVKAMDV